MDKITVARGMQLNRIGELHYVIRKRFREIPLLLGWKLVKEESDEEYKGRILDKFI